MILVNAAGFFMWQGGRVSSGGGADTDGEFSVIFSCLGLTRSFIPPAATEIC